jgi:hypothetical protein
MPVQQKAQAAATRQEERGLAVTGKKGYATGLFERQESVFNAGRPG